MSDLPASTPADNDTSPSLEGKLESVKPLLDALSCIYSSAHKAQDVTISVHTDGGLRFSVEHTGCLQASVILPSSAFTSFHVSSSSVRLRLNLSLFVESLSLFATSPQDAPVSAQLSHNRSGDPLVLRLWDGEADTVCKLSTLALDNDHIAMLDINLAFYQFPLITTAVLSSDILREALSELDYHAASTAEIRLAPTPPKFLLLSPAASLASDLDGLGDDALCTVELPDPHDRTTDVFQSFTCRRSQCSVYKLLHLQRCKQALSLSETCKLQMNAEGMLSIMCRMKSQDSSRFRPTVLDRCFVEFVIAAQEIDEDEDEDDQDQDENDPEQHEPDDGDNDTLSPDEAPGHVAPRHENGNLSRLRGSLMDVDLDRHDTGSQY